MAQVPVPPLGYPQPQQQPGAMNMNLGTPGAVLPNGQFVPIMPGTPGTVLPNGQFVPNAMPGTPGVMNMNLGTPGTAAVLPSGQLVPAPGYSMGGPVYAPGPAVDNVEEGDPLAAPVITREQQQIVGVPRGMTRESMQPGYDPRLKEQRRVFNPAFSFKDSFGNSRNKGCCTIS